MSEYNENSFLPTKAPLFYIDGSDELGKFNLTDTIKNVELSDRV